MCFAYALVEDPKRPGKFFSVELEYPKAYTRLNHIEPSGRSESLGAASERISTEMHLRGRRRAWNM